MTFVTDVRTQRAQVAARFRRRLRWAAYLPLWPMLAFALLLSWAVGALLDRGYWVDHSRTVIAQANRALVSAVEMDSALTSYQLTADAASAAAFRAASAATERELEQLARLVADNPAQQKLVDEIRAQRSAYERQAADLLARAPGAPAIDRLVLRRAFDQFVRPFAQFEAAENQLLAARSGRFNRISRWVLTFRFVGALGIACFLGLAIRRGFRELRAGYDGVITETERTLETLRITFQSIPDGVIATDRSGRIAFMNPAAETLCGWTQSEALDRPITDVFTLAASPDGASVPHPIPHLLQPGPKPIFANGAQLIRRDGRRIPVAANGATIQSDDVAAKGIVIVFRDLTADRGAPPRPVLASDATPLQGT